MTSARVLLPLVVSSGWVCSQADPQGPGNGLSKSTYAASADAALEGMNLLMRLFNTTAALDGSSANVGECPAGTSGVDHAWYETEGRSALPVSSVSYGTCWIKHGELTEEWVWSDITSVTPPSVLGDDCETKSWREVQQKDGGYAYVVLANDAETCCKSCTGDKECTGAVYRAPENEVEGSEQVGHANAGKGFGLHMTSLPGHSTEGGKTVEEIEGIFTQKLGDMSSFDWFMDYNVGLFTYALDDYITKLQALGVPYLPASWKYSAGVGYSVFIHIGKTQLVVELMGLESEMLSNPNFSPKVIGLEQRMTDTRIEEVKTSPPEEKYPFAVSVSRAISAGKLASLEDFYTTGVGATVTRSSTDGDVEQRCYQWPGAAGDVCFRQRSSDSTSSDFTPLDFENMMESTQKVWLSNPMCGMMRWEDNHYAFDAKHGDSSASGNFDNLMDYVLEKNLYYVCADGGAAGAHYVYDPSGWGIQLDVQFTKMMPGCSSEVSSSLEATTSPWCGGGTCSTSTLLTV